MTSYPNEFGISFSRMDEILPCATMQVIISITAIAIVNTEKNLQNSDRRKRSKPSMKKNELE